MKISKVVGIAIYGEDIPVNYQLVVHVIRQDPTLLF